MVAAIVLGVAAVWTPAVAFGATLVFVPPTGMPDPLGEAVKNAQAYYLLDTSCREPGTCDEVKISYPASFWPLTFLPRWCAADCQKWDVSVQDGVEQLAFAMGRALAGTDDKVVLFGHSQGAAVISDTLRSLSDTLTEEEKARLEVVLTGNIDNPAGGLWSRLGFLGHIPILDVTTGLPTPTDTGITFTSIIMQYDGVGDAPKYWGNPLAVANAIAGFLYLHGTTLAPDRYSPKEPCTVANCRVPDYYPTVEQYLAAVRDPANAKTDQFGNTYVTVPTATLPIVMPLLDLAARTNTTAFVKPLVDLMSPVLRVLIDLGYDRNEDPGVYSPLSILPFSLTTNPVTVLDDLAEALVQGIHDAVNGGPTPPVGHPAAPQVMSAGTPFDGDDHEVPTTTAELTSENAPSAAAGVSAVSTTGGSRDQEDGDSGPTDGVAVEGSDEEPPVTVGDGDDIQTETDAPAPDSPDDSPVGSPAVSGVEQSPDSDADESSHETDEERTGVDRDESAGRQNTADQPDPHHRPHQSHGDNDAPAAAAAA